VLSGFAAVPDCVLRVGVLPGVLAALRDAAGAGSAGVGLVLLETTGARLIGDFFKLLGCIPLTYGRRIPIYTV